jgi:hypothetical protein
MNKIEELKNKLAFEYADKKCPNSDDVAYRAFAYIDFKSGYGAASAEYKKVLNEIEKVITNRACNSDDALSEIRLLIDEIKNDFMLTFTIGE